uniref:Putative LOC100169340 [Acyrthosiphon pisum] n=1 Tax=Lepeophtheirus salmonis TaxID=72036 RepID=A0A0K2U2F7_LEPSM
MLLLHRHFLPLALFMVSFWTLNTTAQELQPLVNLRTFTSNMKHDYFPKDCPLSQVQFEIVTGFVFTSPDDMLDSRPGTLMLTDCIELCKQNSTCKSANFETGLCVLFQSSANEFPEGLTTSQFPVFTLYIQKVCLRTGSESCKRAWSFEKIDGYSLETYAKKRIISSGRSNCEELCLLERDFPCRSATYDPLTGNCLLSDMDRHTVAGTPGTYIYSKDFIYLENNCVDDPVKLCDFQLLKHKIMKTVDSVYQDVPTMEACRDLCLAAPYRCHSFDYGDTGDRVCRLSHHTSNTLILIKEPYLIIDDIVGTYELSSCYNVTIDCRTSDMVATVRTNKIFNGKIYAKDNPNSCVVDVQNGIEFSIKMAYNDIECNVKRKSDGVYANEVIIQHHDRIVTSTDLGLALNCQYDLTNRTIQNDFDLSIKGAIEPSLFREEVVESPNVLMKVTGRGGNELNSAQVGDPLELRFKISDYESPYEIFVRDLVAKDGNDQTEISLIDSRGCPSEGNIMGPLRSVQGAKIFTLAAEFDAFKFPTSEIVHFRAHVTPCIPKCKPVRCNAYEGGHHIEVDSYGRRKKRYAPREEEEVNQGSKMLVTQAFYVSDKFKGERRRSSSSPQRNQTNTDHFFNDETMDSSSSTKESVHRESNDICMNLTGIMVAVGVFILIQIGLGLVWNHIRSRRNISKQQENGDFNSNAVIFNPYNHHSRHR